MGVEGRRGEVVAMTNNESDGRGLDNEEDQVLEHRGSLRRFVLRRREMLAGILGWWAQVSGAGRAGRGDG